MKPTCRRRILHPAAASCCCLLVFLLLFTLDAVNAQSPASAPKPLTSIENVVDLVPSSTILRAGSNYNAIGVKQAEDALVLRGSGKPAVLRYKVEVLEATKTYGFDYMILAPITPLIIRGAPCNYRTWAFFRSDKTDSLAKVRVGSTVIILGTLNRINIVMDGGKPLLRLDLDDASLYASMDAATAALAARSSGDPAPEPPKASAPTPAPLRLPATGSPFFGAASPAAVKPQAEVVGIWELDTASPGSQHYTMEVRGDGTWAWDRNFNGTWTVENGLLKMRFTGPGFLDVYKLPVRNGELHGVNGAGGELFMKRKAAATSGAGR